VSVAMRKMFLLFVFLFGFCFVTSTITQGDLVAQEKADKKEKDKKGKSSEKEDTKKKSK